MRKSSSDQLRFDCKPIQQITLNFECRDEIIPILAGLQHLYCQEDVRNNILQLVAQDVNELSRADIGREGLSYWQIFVLSVVRLGCDLDYDKLQDLCENHRTLRCILNVGDWDSTRFGSRRIRDTLSLLKPKTIEGINQLLVTHGQSLVPEAKKQVRADSFVVETNIHYPTESGLIYDGVRKLLPISRKLADSLQVSRWRQTSHHLKKTKQQAREIARLSASDSPKVKAGVYPAYGVLLEDVGRLLDRVRALKKACETVKLSVAQTKWLAEVNRWYEATVKVVDTAFRRTQLREQVPNSDKLFSIFEPHTQLYRRGKAGEPNQFGRLAMVYEDGTGFISHYYLMGRQELDSDVTVEQTKIAQEKHGGQLEVASFDRGYFSPENQTKLEDIIASPCLPPRHRNQLRTWKEEASVVVLKARQRHSGIESRIGSLQSGNGMERCRDRSELGLERYFGLAILGRNIHTLGKLAIAQTHPKSEAARSKRKKAG